MDFARTGPRTVAGRYLRRFWQPVWVGQDLAPGQSLSIRVMSEDFTVARADNGQCSLIGTEGAYLVREYFGLIFGFLGQGEPPAFPYLPHIERRGGVVDAGRGVLPYNFFQQVENSVDEVHVVFVHRDSPFGAEGLKEVPKVSAEETEFGLTVRAALPDGNVRIMHLLMPTVVYVAVYPFQGSGWRDFLAWRVPIDDEHFQTFFLLCANVSGEAAERYLARPERYAPFCHNASMADIGDKVLAGELSIHEVKDPRIVALQDFVSQKGQGIIADREHERLGKSDAGVIMLRRIWEREMRALEAGVPLKEWRMPAELAVTTGI